MSSNHIAESEVPVQQIQVDARIPVNEVESWLRQQILPYQSRVEKLEETERLKNAKIIALESTLLTLQTQLEEAIKHKSAGSTVTHPGNVKHPSNNITGSNNATSNTRPSTTGGKRPIVALHTEMVGKEQPKKIQPIIKSVTGSPQVGKEIKVHHSVTSTPVKKDKDSEKKETKVSQAEENKNEFKENKSTIVDKTKPVEKKTIVRPATMETKENKKVEEKKGIKGEVKKTEEHNVAEKKHTVTAVTGTGLGGKKRETALKDANKDVKDTSNDENKKETDKQHLTKDKVTHAAAVVKDATSSVAKVVKNGTKEVVNKVLKNDDKKNTIPVKHSTDSGKGNTETKKAEKKDSNTEQKKQEEKEEDGKNIVTSAEKTEVHDNNAQNTTNKAETVEVISKESSETNHEVKNTLETVISESSEKIATTNLNPTKEVIQTEQPSENNNTQLTSSQDNNQTTV